MVASVANEGIQSLRVEKEIFIGAPLDIALNRSWRSLVHLESVRLFGRLNGCVGS
jgi:hypothetical protein